MKRYGHLWSEIVSDENLRIAHATARKGKTWQDDVRRVDREIDTLIPALQVQLELGLYKTGKYSSRQLTERGKDRTIFRLPYWPDRVVQHAVCQVLAPIWRSQLVRHTYASIPGRGIHDAATILRDQLRTDRPGTEYCLKMDVRQFYPSIRHDIMKRVLRDRVKDPRVLVWLDEVIDSISVSEPGRGLPIGNYLSQWLANLFLAEADWRFKQHYKIRYYHRYCDDIVALSGSKEHLHEVRTDFIGWLKTEYALDVKGDWQVFPVAVRGIDFVGYRFFHEKTLLRKKLKKRMARALSPARAARSEVLYRRGMSATPSYDGWTRFGSNRNLRRKLIDNWVLEAKNANR